MFLITASFGFLQPFVPLYLEGAGLTRSAIGVVSGIGSGAALLAQPILGRLSDRLDARRPIMLASAILAGLAYSFYRYSEGLWPFIVLTAIGVNGTMYLNAAGGVLIGRVSGRGRAGQTYAAYRVWGSVGYILVAVLSGWLLNRTLAGGSGGLGRSQLDSVFVRGPLIFVLVALAALFVPDVRSEQPHVARPDGLTVGADCVARRVSMSRFLQAFFLYQFSLYGASAYLSLFMKGLGSTPIWITATFAAGVVCEVLVMTRVGRLSDRIGRRPVLAVAFAVLPVRLLCYIPATGPLWVLVVQLLHGFNFGIMGAIAVVFVNDLADERERGAAQARLAAAGGLAVATGPALCGFIAQRFGIPWMFASMSVVGAVGAALFIGRVSEPARDYTRRDTVSAC